MQTSEIFNISEGFFVNTLHADARLLHARVLERELLRLGAGQRATL